MNACTKKRLPQCSVNGCKSFVQQPWHFVCEKCWELTPASLQRNYLAERNAAPGSDSTGLAAQACIEAIQEEISNQQQAE